MILGLATDPSSFDLWSLAAQWVSAGAAVLAVLVAAVFGWLTLANNRRSRDTQERATLIAATEERTSPPSLVAGREGPNDATLLTIRHQSGEHWLLVNKGSVACILDDVTGLTVQDTKRLAIKTAEFSPLNPGEALEFILVSRLALSGPANIVATYRAQPGGSLVRQVLLVPAP